LIETKNWILTGSDDNTARLWDFHSGKEIHKYKLNHNMATVSAVRINHDLTRYTIFRQTYITNQLISLFLCVFVSLA